MRKLIQDGGLIVAAILLTGSTAYAMQPTPEPVKTVTVETTKVPEKVKKAAEKPSKAIQKKKAVTWRDNPNKCSEAQYIAKERPFKCINKTTSNQSAVGATTKSAPVSVSGSCADWIAAAGIKDVGNAQELINRESGCNPNAVNPSSGACGVAQELPCGKSGCSLGDGACQVRWMNSYVLGRYGSWAAAVGFHNANNWY